MSVLRNARILAASSVVLTMQRLAEGVMHVQMCKISAPREGLVKYRVDVAY